MEETRVYNTGGWSSWGVWGFVIFLLILFVAIFAIGNHKETRDHTRDGYKATCDAEKTEIINTARTQYLVEQQAANTRELVAATANATQTKIDFYAYQDLRDRLSKAEMDNYFLKGQIASDARFGQIEKELAAISCQMLRRPDVTGVGVACPSAAILNGLGINSLNGCGCGCNGGLV
jgi:hypothetical protein